MRFISGDLVRNFVGRKPSSTVPRDPPIDSTLSLALEGYPFIWNRCQRFRSDIFTARIMGRPTVCLHGPEAARIFYDSTKVQRGGAVPRRVVTSLFGKGAVHTLDDEPHRRRKAAFMSLMTPASIERLMAFMAERWQLAIRRWQDQPSVVVFDEAQRILTAAACDWVGVPVDADELPLRARQLGEMIDAFGGVGPRLWRGKLARAATERWITERVREVRSGRVTAEPSTALELFTEYRDNRGLHLSDEAIAVELLNLIRPTAAIAWYVAYAALALHDYPEARAKLREAVNGDEDYSLLFMQEVRRFYPFTPYLGAMVRVPFEWSGHSFVPGTRVLLDVYGASRDQRLWREPERFLPERFHLRVEDEYDFIPQGGGSPNHGHRCAGERITMLSLAQAIRFLAHAMSYEVVPNQDLGIDLTRLPARPESGVIIRNVRATIQIELEPARAAEAAFRDHMEVSAADHI